MKFLYNLYSLMLRLESLRTKGTLIDRSPSYKDTPALTTIFLEGTFDRSA